MRSVAILLFFACSVAQAAAETPAALAAAAGRYAAELVRCGNSEWEDVARSTADTLYNHIGHEKALAALEGILKQMTAAKGNCNTQALADTKRAYERTRDALRAARPGPT